MPIYALGEVEPRVDPTAYVHPDAVLIGDVTIGAEASVWPGAVLRGDTNPIRIGARTSVQDGSVVHVSHIHPTSVGADCVIGHLVHLEGCTIEDGVLVGSGAVVSPGTVVPSRARALGVPAKIRPDAVDPARVIAPGVASYLERSRLYRDQLRRID